MAKRIDQTTLKGNKILEQILEDLQKGGPSEEKLHAFTFMLLQRAAEGGTLLTPVICTDENGRVLEGDEIDPEKTEMRIGYQTVQDEEEQEWIPVYTSGKESIKGGPMDLTQLDIFRLLMLSTVIDDIAGIVFNPFGNMLCMPMDTVESVLDMAMDMADAAANQMDGDIDLVQEDIASLSIDCIVNAANNMLTDGAGVNGRIHEAAGPKLDEACRALHGCRTGEAKITEGFDLPARYIIHTAGPVYSGREEDAELLADCYWNAMDVAAENDLHGIAFPCISTGIFGYPKDEAAHIAIETVLNWLDSRVTDYDLHVVFCVHSDSDYQRYENILNDLLGDEM